MQDLYNTSKPSDICPDCKIIKVPRSRHCHQCHKCVKKFDHHCQWLNNCIGAKNIGIFYIFIIVLWVNIIIGFFLCISTFMSKEKDNDGDNISLTASQTVAGFCIFFELFTFVPVSFLLFTHSKNICLGLTTNERHSAVKVNRKTGSCCSNCTEMICNTGKDDDVISRPSADMFEISLQESGN